MRTSAAGGRAAPAAYIPEARFASACGGGCLPRASTTPVGAGCVDARLTELPLRPRLQIIDYRVGNTLQLAPGGVALSNQRIRSGDAAVATALGPGEE
jgi:hypothetical protein